MLRQPQYRPQLHRPRACPLHVPFLPHCKSESLSVFRKSCLARSRISGSSLEVRGKGLVKQDQWLQQPGPSLCQLLCTHCHRWSSRAGLWTLGCLQPTSETRKQSHK